MKRAAVGIGEEEELDCSGDGNTAFTNPSWEINRLTGN
jgi:hypothetical protein